MPLLDAVLTPFSDGIDLPEAPGLPEYLPARMLNEFAYCPRLFWLEWVEREFKHSADTLDGSFTHRNTDDADDVLPDPDGHEPGLPTDAAPEGEAREADAAESIAPPEGTAPATIHARSVTVSSQRLRLIAKIDLVEADGATATPVEYKRGKKPNIAEGVYAPERVQLCAQALLLEENGYTCDRGFIYFAGSRQRVEVKFDFQLIQETVHALRRALGLASTGLIPAPLVDSPKCVRCSLAPICLPDEVTVLNSPAPHDPETMPLRKITPARDDALPVYIQKPGARISLRGDMLKIEAPDHPGDEVRIAETSRLNLMGRPSITVPALHALLDAGVPVFHYSSGGWFRGVTTGMPGGNIELRRAQFRAADDTAKSLTLARKFVSAKIRNQRTLLRRNHAEPPDDVLKKLARYATQAESAESAATLLGIEGNAAREYFGQFASMIRPRDPSQAWAFDFDGRNRRPPKDAVNAMLSLAYSLLAREFTGAALAVSLDPHLGMFHQPRFGRPALALDLMEEFRPLVADSTVITAINTGAVSAGDFVSGTNACNFTDTGRKAFIAAYERRMDQLVTHPVFGYQISYRRVIDVQTRLLARTLTGELAAYPSFLTR